MSSDVPAQTNHCPAHCLRRVSAKKQRNETKKSCLVATRVPCKSGFVHNKEQKTTQEYEAIDGAVDNEKKKRKRKGKEDMKGKEDEKEERRNEERKKRPEKSGQKSLWERTLQRR